MASKLTKLRMPQYSPRQANVPAYTKFLKTVYEYNSRRKDIMANHEDEINNCYKQLVHNTHASSSDRARLVEQVNNEQSREMWKKCTPENVVISSGPRIEGTMRVPINNRMINVPRTSKGGVKSIDYIYFASVALPRANPGVKLNRETTDGAWSAYVAYILEKNWNLRSRKARTGGLSGQSRSHAADKYWAEREAKQKASEQEKEEEDP